MTKGTQTAAENGENGLAHAVVEQFFADLKRGFERTQLIGAEFIEMLICSARP